MDTKYVTVRNLDTGGVSKMLEAHATHPVFGRRVEIVPAGTKKKILIPERLREPAVDLAPVEVVADEVDVVDLDESPKKGRKVKNG